MKPFEKMTGENGLQNALFPLPNLYVTNNEAGHNGRMIIDIVDWTPSSGQILKAPLYAPCDVKCVYVGSLSTNTPTVCWESLDRVNFVDGEVDYITISLSHDDNFASYTKDEVIFQGEVFGHTGTTGIGTGDHCHLIIGKGKYKGYGNLGKGYTLLNEYHAYNALGINNTNVYQSGGYTWKEFTPYVPPEPPTHKKDIMPLSLVGALKWSV